MTNTPSETEIDNLLCKHWPAYSMQAVLVKMWLREAIESAIAKWGTPQPVVREPLTCEWTHNDDDGYWDTSCGKAWRFDDGGPKENNMNFCHCCGKTLRIKGGQHGAK